MPENRKLLSASGGIKGVIKLDVGMSIISFSY